MKKQILTLLCCTILLTACGTPAEEVQNPEAESVVAENEEEFTPADEEVDADGAEPLQTEADSESDEPDTHESESILGYQVFFEDVSNGSESDIIGQRAYIEMPKSDLESLSEDQYSELCSYVETLDYNWFSVICDDNTGLVFTGCATTIVTYGQLDDLGRVDSTLGDIVKSGDSFSYSESQ